MTVQGPFGFDRSFQRERPRAYADWEEFLRNSGSKRGFYAKKAEGETPAEIRIYDVIGTDFWTGEGFTAKACAEMLDQIAGAKALNIYINSPGGSVWEGKTIFAQLGRFPGTKTVYVDGIAGSAASFIAMAGDRIITEPAGTWFIHRVMGGASGYAKDLRKMADDIDVETESIAEVYVRRTGLSKKAVYEIMDGETYIGAAEAKRLGFTDEIAGETEAAQNAAPAPSPLSTAARFDLVTARARAHRERFAGASPDSTPGQPGTSTQSHKR